MLRDQDSNNLLNGVRSSYVLKIILENVNKRAYYQVFRYNKRLKERIELTLEDYHQLYKIYSKLEIEITPLKFYPYFLKRNFININNNDSFYHMYYLEEDGKKSEEIIKDGSFKKNYKKILIIIDTEFESLNGLFKDIKAIYKIKFLKF